MAEEYRQPKLTYFKAHHCQLPRLSFYSAIFVTNPTVCCYWNVTSPRGI